MKARLVLLAALGLFATTPALAAKGDKWLGVQLGRSLPSRDFRRSAEGGFEGGLVLTSMEAERVGVGVDLAYHSWDGSDEAKAQLAALLGPDSQVAFDAIQATMHVLYDFRPRASVRPYAKGGVGLYSVQTKFATSFGAFDSRDWNFAYNVGGGLNLIGGRSHAVGFGGMYHIIKSTGFETRLVTVGVNLLWKAGGP
jgi:opacity protein-like surface antigen